MKKNLLVFIVLGIVVTGYAQQHQDLTAKINDINKRIGELTTMIGQEHQAYSKQAQYSDKGHSEAVNKFNQDKRVLTDSIATIQADIKSLDKEYQWLGDIRKFYQQNMDTVFAHADLVSLECHKKILGKDYPREMDELKILLDCSAILTKAYNATLVQSNLQKLDKVGSSKSKDNLKDLLEMYKDITDEVNNWKKENDFSLHSMMIFYNKLSDNYGVALESDYPYLSDEVKKAVKQHLEVMQSK